MKPPFFYIALWMKVLLRNVSLCLIFSTLIITNIYLIIENTIIDFLFTTGWIKKKTLPTKVSKITFVFEVATNRCPLLNVWSIQTFSNMWLKGSVADCLFHIHVYGMFSVVYAQCQYKNDLLSTSLCNSLAKYNNKLFWTWIVLLCCKF